MQLQISKRISQILQMGEFELANERNSCHQKSFPTSSLSQGKQRHYYKLFMIGLVHCFVTFPQICGLLGENHDLFREIESDTKF